MPARPVSDPRALLDLANDSAVSLRSVSFSRFEDALTSRPRLAAEVHTLLKAAADRGYSRGAPVTQSAPLQAAAEDLFNTASVEVPGAVLCNLILGTLTFNPHSEHGGRAWLDIAIDEQNPDACFAQLTLTNNFSGDLDGIQDARFEFNGENRFYVDVARALSGTCGQGEPGIVWYRYWWYDSHHHPWWWFGPYRWWWTRYNWFGFRWKAWWDWWWVYWHWLHWWSWSNWWGDVIGAHAAPAPPKGPSGPPLPRTQPRHCVITPPCNCSITVAIPNGPRLSYEVTGLFEYAVDSARRNVTISVLNLTGRYVGEPVEGVPPEVHLRAASFEPPSGSLNEEGRGFVAIPVKLDYAMLGDYPERIQLTGEADCPYRTIPLDGQIQLSISIGIGGTTSATGSGTAQSFPPVSDEAVDLNLTIECGDGSGYPCRIMPLCVKVYEGDKQPVNKDNIADLIAKVNAIFGCPGQCCIKFELKDDKATFDKDLPKVVKAKTEKAKEYENLQDLVKDGKWRGQDCINVYLVGKITGDFPDDDTKGRNARPIAGVALRDKDNPGIVVGMNASLESIDLARDLDEIARTFAHELGHMMDLDHKDKDERLMKSGGSGKELVAWECRRIWNSALFKLGKYDFTKECAKLADDGV